jgi:hypothetical protein
MQSPTNQTVDQRSILFMPLKNPAEQDGPPMGFVSIDCKRPFAFYGARARDIASDCQALVDQIAAIVAVQPNTAKPKTRNA